MKIMLIVLLGVVAIIAPLGLFAALCFAVIVEDEDRRLLKERLRRENSATMLRISVEAEWNPDTRTWFCTSDDVAGLMTESPTLEILQIKLRIMIPALLESARHSPFDIVIHHQQRAQESAYLH